MGSDNGKTQDNGLPVMTVNSTTAPIFRMLASTVAVLVVNIAIGYGVVTFGDYDSKIEEVLAQDLHYVFAALVVLARTVSFINLLPMIYKANIMKRKSGNLRANMLIYKVRKDAICA